MSQGKQRRIPTWVWINLGAAMLSVGLYVFFSHRLQGIGFPLDDAWIHQTYARNLAELGEWSFVPGMTSAGSTSPFWTFILALLYLVAPSTPYYLTYFLGALVLWSLACLAELIFRTSFQSIKGHFPIAGMFLAFEWHLVWSGASGMETLLTAVVVLTVFYFLQANSQRGYGLAGLIIGIGVWVRPDALTLIGPLWFVIFLRSDSWSARLKPFGYSLVALMIPLSAYLVFNYWLSGNIWPNTFYAKQAEYAVLREIPILTRYLRILSLPMVGVGVLLLPGFIYKTIRAIQSRNYCWIGAALWWLGYSLVYALQLPVTYQHGRYLIPAMPVFFLVGLVGSLEGLKIEQPFNRLRWVLTRTWAGASIVVLTAFYIIGGQSYAKDVAIINTEMVVTAQWLRENTSTDDLIAVHDIGAVGYFSQRKIIDLAGLATPEIIPMIRDEGQLAAFLDKQDADYLMTFPEWYSTLTSGLKPAYTSTGSYSQAAGGENMVVYRWGQD